MERIYSTHDNYEVKLNLDNQRLSINIKDSTLEYNLFEIDEYDLVERSSVNINGDEIEIRNLKKDISFEDKLLPSLDAFDGHIEIGSISLFSQKAKQVDDRIYAAVEKMLQCGTNTFTGKRNFLEKWAEWLEDEIVNLPNDPLVDAFAFIQTARRLGGADTPGKSPDILIRKAGLKSKKLQRTFLEDDFQATPIGIYCNDEELKSIFLQDRFLQQSLSIPVIEVLGKLITENSDLCHDYKKLTKFVQRLTNPYVGASLLEGTGNSKVLPASRSHETEIVKKLFGFDPIPEGFDLTNEMIQQIRDGRLSLQPDEDSGWYDYQTYAFEPLLLPERCPESQKLTWGEKYLKYLEEMFVALLAATRETHVKQLESPIACSAATPIFISPNLSIEPLPEYFVRRAYSYQYLRNILLDFFGETILIEQGILNEVLNMENLFFGAYVICCEEIGLDSQAPMLTQREKHLAKAYTRTWLENIKQDKDIGEDIRAMVPLFFDDGRKKIKVLAILGYSKIPLTIDFVDMPEVKIYRKASEITSDADVRWVNQETTVFKLETVEIYVDQLLDREIFRTICDQYRTKSKIIAALTRSE